MVKETTNAKFLEGDSLKRVPSTERFVHTITIYTEKDEVIMNKYVLKLMREIKLVMVLDNKEGDMY